MIHPATRMPTVASPAFFEPTTADGATKRATVSRLRDRPCGGAQGPRRRPPRSARVRNVLNGAGQVSFRNPPVAEVLIGVTFRPVPGLGSYRAWPLFERWKASYPLPTEQPELPPQDHPSGQPGTFIRLGAPSTRLWFESPTDGFLIQLQADRLVVNWRAGDQQFTYPRYPALRSRFESAVSDLKGELSQGEFVPSLVEVTYVNSIPHPPRHVLQGWSELVVMHQETGVQGATSESEISLGGLSGLARRREAVQGILDNGGQTHFASTILVPITEDSQLMTAADAARQHIVERFRDVTTPAMRREWGEDQ